MRLLALLGMKLLVYDDAEFLLESCVELEPDYWLARLDYVKVLHRRQKFDKALEQAKILRDMHPENRLFEITLANENVAVGNFDAALRAYDRVIEEHPSLTPKQKRKRIGKLKIPPGTLFSPILESRERNERRGGGARGGRLWTRPGARRHI